VEHGGGGLKIAVGDDRDTALQRVMDFRGWVRVMMTIGAAALSTVPSIGNRDLEIREDFQQITSNASSGAGRVSSSAVTRRAGDIRFQRLQQRAA